MSALVQKLSAYAAYHSDPRNVSAHLLGIPLIVVAVEVLLSRPVFAGWVSPAVLVSVLAAIYYLSLDIGLGLALAVFMGLAAWAGLGFGHLHTGPWLATGVGLFVIGWVIQFIGHGFEGKKPAFLDDLTSLLIGPLFVAAEVLLWLRLRPDLKGAVQPPC
jgi:uncharacterized membrane protein YGL010W